MLETNLPLIENLYNKLRKKETTTRSKSHGRSKFLSHHNLTEHIFNSSHNLNVSMKKIQASFILSKMTVELENEDGPREYN